MTIEIFMNIPQRRAQSKVNYNALCPRSLFSLYSRGGNCAKIENCKPIDTTGLQPQAIIGPLQIMQLPQPVRWFFQSTTPKARRTRSFVKLAILIGLFIAMFWIVPFEQVIRAMLNADPTLVAIGMLLGFTSIFLRSAEMEPLIWAQGIQHGAWSITKINLSVKFYTQFLPTSLVGSGIRWYRLSQPGGKGAESLAALAFIRLLETFLTMAIGLSFWLLSGARSLQTNAIWLASFLLGIILAWILITRYSQAAYDWFKRRTGGFLSRPTLLPITRRFEKLLTAISTYARIPFPDLFWAVAAGTASMFIGIASGVFLGFAVGNPLSFLQLGWIQALVTLTTQLPFNIAGGLGFREVTLVAILATFGVRPELSLALSFLILLRQLLISLLGGLVELSRVIRSRHSTRSIPADEKIRGA
jgi:uncharacterized protein (TIRG00374 family)